jgi:hypothetical protein
MYLCVQVSLCCVETRTTVSQVKWISELFAAVYMILISLHVFWALRVAIYVELPREHTKGAFGRSRLYM